MKKAIIIFLFAPVFAYSQTWTQQMVDSSKSEFCGTDTTLMARFDIYIDSVMNYNNGGWKLIAGDTTLSLDSMKAIFRDTVVGSQYFIKPKQPHIIQ